MSAIGTTDRILADMEGCALALLCVGLGFIAKVGGERLEEDGPTSLGEALRK